MKSLRWGTLAFTIALIAGALTTACSPTFVVVPRPDGDYSTIDTLRAYRNGDEVRVTFRYDTIIGVDTVLRIDTVAVERTDTLVRVDSVVRVDTLRTTVLDTVLQVDTVLRVDTLAQTDTVELTRTVVQVDTVVRMDTVRVPITKTVVRVDTLRVDTVRIPITRTEVRWDTVVRLDTVVHTDTVVRTNTVVRVDTVVRTDTLRLATTDTIRLATTDTVHLTTMDTIRLAVVDTIVRTDTVRVEGRRLLFVPPGHYPPEGQCRVWVHGLPPGQQAKAAACTALGSIPDGAFVLFGGDAWDFDYDWIAAAAEGRDTAPPEIISLQRGG